MNKQVTITVEHFNVSILIIELVSICVIPYSWKFSKVQMFNKSFQIYNIENLSQPTTEYVTFAFIFSVILC